MLTVKPICSDFCAVYLFHTLVTLAMC